MSAKKFFQELEKRPNSPGSHSSLEPTKTSPSKSVLARFQPQTKQVVSANSADAQQWVGKTNVKEKIKFLEEFFGKMVKQMEKEVNDEESTAVKAEVANAATAIDVVYIPKTLSVVDELMAILKLIKEKKFDSAEVYF
jgi:hypothetical protein